MLWIELRDLYSSGYICEAIDSSLCISSTTRSLISNAISQQLVLVKFMLLGETTPVTSSIILISWKTVPASSWLGENISVL